MENQVFAAVKAIIENKGKYLLLKQKVGDDFIYDLPGGKVEYGESPYDTLHREIKEETDLEVEVLKPLGMWWFFRKKDNNQVVCNTFLCKAKHIKIDLSNNTAALTEDIQEVSWVTKEEMLSKIDNQSLKDIVALLQ